MSEISSAIVVGCLIILVFNSYFIKHELDKISEQLEILNEKD